MMPLRSRAPLGKTANSGWLRVCCGLGCGLALSVSLPAAELTLSATPDVRLPPLRIDGEPARAHTQGVWVSDEGEFYATARRDDVAPRRALLLRTRPNDGQWTVWDITPPDRSADGGAPTRLDHPGGFDVDRPEGSAGGEACLWIPVSTSTPHGPTLIRAYRLSELKQDAPARPTHEYLIDDHVGALAVSSERNRLYGATWDTRRVYIWDRDGRLVETLEAKELRASRLGSEGGAANRAGLAVQDWKRHHNSLYAVGLLKGDGVPEHSPRSRLFVLGLDLDQQPKSFRPLARGGPDLELGREGMALVGNTVYFLPEDLGASNRVFVGSLPPLK